MGFYKFYKIIKDFLHKPFKTAFIFIVIAMIISIFSGSAFAAESDNYYQNDNNYKVDPVLLCNHYQNSVLSTLYNSLLYNKKYNIDKTTLNTLISTMSTNFYYCEYRYPLNSSYADIYVYIYDKHDIFESTEINTHFTFGNDYVNVPIVARNLSARRYLINSSTYRITSYSDKYTVSIPSILCGMRNSNFDELLYNFNNKSTDDLYVILQNINENIKKTNDFLNNKNVDESSMSIPSDTSSDSTESGFNEIFDKVYDAFTNTDLANGASIKFTIPYIDYPVEIPSGINSLYLKIKHPEFRPLISLFEMLWWFGISYYIVKDVNKYIDDIKNGNINTTDTNIKTEML